MTGAGIRDVSDQPLDRLWSLAGRRAIVTGGGRGLGAAIAARLAEAGASVAIGDRDQHSAIRVTEHLAARFGHPVLATRLDVTKADSVAALARTATDQFGGIDIWVNNAGVFPSSPLVDLSEAGWDHVLDINLRGTFLGCREAARQMKDQGEGGVIVNLASVAGLRGRNAGVIHYVASKHGVVGITQQLALELAPDRIRVLAVAPTTIRTPGVEESLTVLGGDNPPDFDAALTKPLGRPGVPDDVARVVLFCASDMATFMTGSTLTVDAGELAR